MGVCCGISPGVSLFSLPSGVTVHFGFLSGIQPFFVAALARWASCYFFARCPAVRQVFSPLSCSLVTFRVPFFLCLCLGSVSCLGRGLALTDFFSLKFPIMGGTCLGVILSPHFSAFFFWSFFISPASLVSFHIPLLRFQCWKCAIMNSEG